MMWCGTSDLASLNNEELAYNSSCPYFLVCLFHSSGVVELYSGDETMGTWNLSHTLEFTRRQFPGNLFSIQYALFLINNLHF